MPDNINSTITQVLAPLGLDPQQLDFLSIDVDGMDIYLLEAFEFRPKALCI